MSEVEMSDPDTIMESQECMEINTEDPEWVFVDVQGYKVNKNRFMCKEFCMVNGEEIFHAIAKPWLPYKKLMSHYKRQVDWLTRYFHGLEYDSGDVDISELTKIVYPKLLGKTVIVKGADKINWIKYIFRKYDDISCINIENLDYDISEDLNEEYGFCKHHTMYYGFKKCHCAKANALMLQKISNINAPIRFF